MELGADHYFGGGGESSIHPAILCILVLAALAILFVRRQYLVYPFIITATIIPAGQVVVVGGMHFMALRILIVAGLLRLVVSRFLLHSEPPQSKFTSIDKLFVMWIVSNTIAFTILWGAWGALTNRLGFALTCLGSYTLLRFMIRDEEDVGRTIRILAALSFIAGILMLNEYLTGRNLVGLFGGVPVEVTVRDGVRRAQAMFTHPLMAGAFGGTLVTLFIGFWWKNKKNRRIALLGGVGALLMAVMSMSSTSLLDVVVGLMALGMWPLRRLMRVVRWSAVAVIVGLHLVMKAPVWSLIARIDLTGGSSGYHRYELINQAILRFSEWWLIGTRYQSSWGWDMWDSINWYVNEGVEGGLLTLILFVSVIAYCFKRIGTARQAAESDGDRAKELFIWAIGATLFTNAVSFIGISYFDQSIVMWFAFLALISTVTTHAPADEPIKEPESLRLAPTAKFALTSPSFSRSSRKG